MTEDLSSVEVLVKIDDDKPEFATLLEEEKRRRAFDIRFCVSPRLGGQFTLWLALDYLLSLTSPDSYFVQIVTDEARLETKAWDRILEKYVGAFPDQVYRLRVSQHKYATNPDLFSCIYMPECFPIYTRRWLELTEGFGDCYGSDAHQQCIAFHLALGIHGYSNIWHRGALFRDIQVHEIKFGGFEFGQDVGATQKAAHVLRMQREWRRLITYQAQTEFAYLARRIYLYVWACKEGIESFYVKKLSGFTAGVFDAVTDRELLRVSYRLSRWHVCVRNIRPAAALLFRDILYFVRGTPWISPIARVASYIRTWEYSRIATSKMGRRGRLGSIVIGRLVRIAHFTYFLTLRPFLSLGMRDKIRVQLVSMLSSMSANEGAEVPNRLRRSILPAGLERMENPLPFSFAARYKKTGYVIPDYDAIHREYRRMLVIRQKWSEIRFRSEKPSETAGT